jgi:hypothetical protein
MITVKDTRELMDFVWKDLWVKKYKELLGCYKYGGPDGLQNTVAAYIRTHFDGVFKDVVYIIEHEGAFVLGRDEDGNLVSRVDEELIDAYMRSYSQIFVSLVEDGALDRLLLVEDFSEKQNALYEEMEAEAAKVGTRVAEPAAPPVKVDYVALCIADFRNLGSQDFKKKWIDDQRMHPYYDQACNTGRI